MNQIIFETFFRKITPILFSLAILSSCSTIGPFDQKAYEQAISLKVDTKNVLSLATAPYKTHGDEVKELKTNLEKAYEYALGRPKNEDSIGQWQVLLNPEGDLLGGLLREWKEEGPLLPGYIRSKQNRIGSAFDKISSLESGKNKPTDAP